MMKEEIERNRIRINKLESDDMESKLKRISSLESKATKKVCIYKSSLYTIEQIKIEFWV